MGFILTDKANPQIKTSEIKLLQARAQTQKKKIKTKTSPQKKQPRTSHRLKTKPLSKQKDLFLFQKELKKKNRILKLLQTKSVRKFPHACNFQEVNPLMRQLKPRIYIFCPQSSRIQWFSTQIHSLRRMFKMKTFLKILRIRLSEPCAQPTNA